MSTKHGLPPLAVLLTIIAFMLALIVAGNVSGPTSRVECVLAEDKTWSCTADGVSELLSETYEDGSFRITGCIAGEVCED